MKKILLVFVVLVLIFVFIAGLNNNPGRIILNLGSKMDNIENRQLHYGIYLFGVFPVGRAVLGTGQLEDYMGQKVYHLNASAKTANVVSGVFSASAVLDSYVDTQLHSPVLFTQTIKASGKEDIHREVYYDQKEGVMNVSGVKRAIPVDTQDPLSALFNIMRMDFDKIYAVEMNINTNQKNYILKGDAVQRDLTADKKKHKIILVKANVTRKEKSPYHKSSVTMLLLKKSRNIPILIKVFSSGLLIKARLVDIN